MNQPARAPLSWLPRVAAQQPMGAGDPLGCSPWLVDANLPPLQNAENILSGKPHPLYNHHPHRMTATGISSSPMMSDYDPRKQAMPGGGGGDNGSLPHLFRPNAAFDTSATTATTTNKWDSEMSDACIINTCLGGFTLNTHQPPLLENGLPASFRIKDSSNINNHHNENLFSAIDNGDFEGYSWPEFTLTDDFNNQNSEIMGFSNPPMYEEETKEGPDDDRLMFLLLQLGIHRCPVLPDLRLHDNELDLYTVHH